MNSTKVYLDVMTRGLKTLSLQIDEYIVAVSSALAKNPDNENVVRGFNNKRMHIEHSLNTLNSKLIDVRKDLMMQTEASSRDQFKDLKKVQRGVNNLLNRLNGHDPVEPLVTDPAEVKLIEDSIFLLERTINRLNPVQESETIRIALLDEKEKLEELIVTDEF